MNKLLLSTLILSVFSTSHATDIYDITKQYGAAGSRDTGAHVEAYAGNTAHPVYQNLNWSNDNIALSFDGYFNGSQWVNSGTTRSYQIYKEASKLSIKTATPSTAGSPVTFNTVFEVDNDKIKYGLNKTRTETNCTPGNFGVNEQSGSYECGSVQNNPTQWPTSATGWWHLNVTRHSTTGNNYALQTAGSFFDQQLWYRKVNNSGTTAWTKVKPADDFYGSRANLLMTGGGTVTHSATGALKWTERFIILGGGRGSPAGITSTAGYYDINMPAVGTVIAGLGGTAPVTVGANGIPMPLWHALFYKLNPTGGANTVNANFSIVNYSSQVSITDDMVLVAVTNSDPSGTSSSFVKLGTGQMLFRNNSTFRGGTPVSIINYASSALAIADATLPAGANYTVNVGGSKQLYVK